MSKFRQADRFLAAFLTLAMLSGCAARGASQKDSLTKEELMNRAKHEKMRGKLSEAREKFQRVFEEAQDNKLRAEALMEVADSYYAEQELQQAEFNYKRFLEHFPAHPEAAKAQYRLGMVNFLQVKSYDRDQTNAKKSVEEFKKVINNYPKSPYTADARRKINFSLNRLAQHELYVSKYYYEKKAYKAAISRLEAVLSDYPGAEFEDEALFYLGQSYLDENKRAKAAEVYQKLIERYPQSKYSSQARSKWRIDLAKAETPESAEEGGRTRPAGDKAGAQGGRADEKTDESEKEVQKGVLGWIGKSFKSITNIFK